MTAPGSSKDTLRQWQRLLSEAGTSPLSFAVPGLLMFLASTLEGLSVALLVPTLEGMLSGEFDRVEALPVVGGLLRAAAEQLGTSEVHRMALLVAAICAAILLKVAVFFRARVIFVRKASELAEVLRRRLFQRYLGFGKQFFDEHNAGHLQSVLLGHTSILGSGAATFGLALNHVFTIGVFLALMLWLSWSLTLLVGALFPLLFICLSRVVAKIKAHSDHVYVAQRRLQELTFNIMSCMPLVKAYQQQARELERFGAACHEVATVELDQQRRQCWLGPIQELLLLAFVVVLVLFVSTFRLEAPASVLVFFYVLKRTSTYVNDLNYLRTELARISSSLSSVLDGLTDPDKPVVSEGSVEFSGLRERIDFDRLSFSYGGGGQRVLSDITFSVRRGTTTAIVGRTGSGKSTIVNLLMRFYDVGPGAIRLDGVDIREFSHESLRRHIAVVPQDCQLFNGTMRSNLLYGLEREVGQDELATALRSARLEQLVERLPDGLETVIGDRGVKLSGGEKQRLAIARALLKRSEILILDEATSSLDSRTERLVQEAIDECLTGRTAIVVAHRLATIRHADEIVLIEDGVLVERGTLDELLAARAAFFAYWEAQQFERGSTRELEPEGRPEPVSP